MQSVRVYARCRLAYVYTTHRHVKTFPKRFRLLRQGISSDSTFVSWDSAGLCSKPPLEGYSVFLSYESAVCKTEIKHPRVPFSNVSLRGEVPHPSCVIYSISAKISNRFWLIEPVISILSCCLTLLISMVHYSMPSVPDLQLSGATVKRGTKHFLAGTIA